MPGASKFLALAFVLVLALCGGEDSASAQERPRLHTNETYVEEITTRAPLNVGDAMAVFAYVLESLPERVKVYPTENHYYFSFIHDGVRYAGNIKLDARTRDQGRVHFAYYEDVATVQADSFAADVMLDASREVSVEKAAPLAYRLTYRSKSVVFELNDLADAKPPAAAIASDEVFIGPVFDESGVRFFLMFNARLKIFLYVLDETVRAADRFTAIAGNDRIRVGKRTEFALYRDHRLDRKILIGALEANVAANNYFDGPFDQMPDNFNDGETLQRALLAAHPYLAGKIDRFGAFSDGSRFAIVPYMHYRKTADLDVFHRCARDRRVAATAYHRCFVLAGEDRGRSARPTALPRRGSR